MIKVDPDHDVSIVVNAGNASDDIDVEVTLNTRESEIDHPLDSNKIIGLFDDGKVGDPLNEAYYCTQAWRDANVGSSLQILTQTEAEAEGFNFGEE